MKNKNFSGIQAKEGTFQGKTSRIVDFLNDNYNIAIDELDKSRMYITAKDGNKKNYKYDPTFNDIILHMWDENISVSDNVLMKIITSPNYIKTDNPIVKYFNGLEGKYKGKSHIDLLCSFLKSTNYGDKKNKNFYQERMTYLIRKWIVALVAQVKGLRMNDVALGFVHAKEGIGKTYLTQFFIPKAISFYYESISPDYKVNMTLEEYYSRNLIVNHDELNGINKKNPEEFKRIMSAEEFTIRFPRDPFPKKVKRYASVMFTSNRTCENGGFLTPDMGLRRYATVELEEINWQEYNKVIDIDQIYAEALMLLKEDFEYSWVNDYDELKEFNTRFLIESPSMKYIRMYFRQPENGEGKFMSAQQIFDKLIVDKKIRPEDFGKVSAQKIGEALHAYSFTKVQKYDNDKSYSRYGYDVTCIYDLTN